jgi:hypothetical protein
MRRVACEPFRRTVSHDRFSMFNSGRVCDIEHDATAPRDGLLCGRL